MVRADVLTMGWLSIVAALVIGPAANSEPIRGGGVGVIPDNPYELQIWIDARKPYWRSPVGSPSRSRVHR